MMPGIDGIEGNNGWYTSNVTVSSPSFKESKVSDTNQ